MVPPLPITIEILNYIVIKLEKISRSTRLDIQYNCSLGLIFWSLVCIHFHISPGFDSPPKIKLSLLGQSEFGLRSKWFTWWAITDDWSTLWHYSEGIPNSGQTVWYAFGLVHSVALSAFLPAPTGSADRVYQKKKKKNSIY